MSNATTMIPVRSDLARQMSQYIENAQSIITKQATTNSAITRAAPAVIDALASQGCIHANLKEATAREWSQHPEKMLDAISKLAERVNVPSVGGPVRTKRASFGQSEDVSKGSADRTFVQVLTGGMS